MRRADHSSRVVFPSVVCSSVIVNFDNEEAVPHQGLSYHEKKSSITNNNSLFVVILV